MENFQNVVFALIAVLSGLVFAGFSSGTSPLWLDWTGFGLCCLFLGVAGWLGFAVERDALETRLKRPSPPAPLTHTLRWIDTKLQVSLRPRDISENYSGWGVLPLAPSAAVAKRTGRGTW